MIAAELDPTLPSVLPGQSALVADIGGSNARFGWVDPGHHAARHVQTLPVHAHGDIAEAAHFYLDGLRRTLGADFEPPRRAALAVATAVTGDRIEFTNSPWSFSRRALQATLALQQLCVLNDFEALALALPHLTADQLRHHAGPVPDRHGARAVIGPGTGLGVGGALPTPRGWMAIPGEGGHATIAPGNDEEDQILRIVRRRFEHVSAERLLSGIGLPVLHAATAELHGAPTPGDDWTAPAILEQGLAGDAVARHTLELFCGLLGSFAGNVALTLGARGGVYIGGGIVPRLGDFFFNSSFRARFEAKGRLTPYVAGIPTAVIVDTLAALTGAAASLDPA